MGAPNFGAVVVFAAGIDVPANPAKASGLACRSTGLGLLKLKPPPPPPVFTLEKAPNPEAGLKGVSTGILAP